mgnify:CR=1 FL=1
MDNNDKMIRALVEHWKKTNDLVVAFEDFDGQMHRHMIHLPNEDVESRKSYVGQITLDINGKKMRKTAYGKTERIVKNKLLEYRIQAKLKKLTKHIITHTPQLKKTKDTAVKLTLHRF